MTFTEGVVTEASAVDREGLNDAIEACMLRKMYRMVGDRRLTADVYLPFALSAD